MSKDDAGQGNDPKDPNDGQGQDPKNEQVFAKIGDRTYESEKDFNDWLGKRHSAAYNDGKSKVIKDAKETFGVDIDDYENPSDFFAAVKDQIAKSDKKDDSGEGNSEVEELKRKLKEAQNEAKDAKNEFNSFKTNQKIEGQMDKAINDIAQNFKKLSVKPDHLKQLFKNENEVVVSDDGDVFVQKPDGTPVLDNEGNRDSVSNVLQRFVKENEYATPLAEGADGGTGSGGTGKKPSKSEWRKLIQSTSEGSVQKAAEMYQNAKEYGWAE